MNLNQIIKRKKEEFEKEFATFNGENIEPTFNDLSDVGPVKKFLEKAIRESVEEALREVRPEEYTHFDVLTSFDNRVKEFMK